jgi:hypothetical protein
MNLELKDSSCSRLQPGVGLAWAPRAPSPLVTVSNQSSHSSARHSRRGFYEWSLFKACAHALDGTSTDVASLNCPLMRPCEDWYNGGLDYARAGYEGL